MSTTTETVAEVIASLEAELREVETHGGRLRDTLSELRRIWGISPLSPLDPAHHPAPAAAAGQASTRPVQSATPVAPAPKPPVVETDRRLPSTNSRNREATLERVLKVAGTLDQPFSSGQLRPQLKDIPYQTLKGYLAALAATGGLTKTGVRAGTRYAVVSQGNAGARPKATPAPAGNAGVSADALIPAVKRVLATGASYDLRELLRQLRGIAPTLTESRLEPIVLGLVEQRQVQRIVTESGQRFRRRAA